MITTNSLQEIGPFHYRWPAEVEAFHRGWEGKVEFQGRTFRVRHGMGRRVVYGRPRVHTVTWVDGWPAVEGVEADDYRTSRALLTRIKRGRNTHVFGSEGVPNVYRDYEVLVHRVGIAAPYSPNSLALKIVEDDLERWVVHAIVRFLDRRSVNPAAFQSQQPLAPKKPTQSAPGFTPAADRASIVKALIQYGGTQHSPLPDGRPSFTPEPEANDLIINDPFAFLLAVILDQGWLAERVWSRPWELKKRLERGLGTFSPDWVAARPEDVKNAIQERPALHRYVNKMTQWIVAAANRVVTDYHGDASLIWKDCPSAAGVQDRFVAFLGIGQKKAAMAVGILVRDLKVPVPKIEENDIAYDVHLRRVFLRSGLAESDDQAHMIGVARHFWPAWPGALDLPAWLVGRNWCHASLPDCPNCAITVVCPKFVGRTEGVKGA